MPVRLNGSTSGYVELKSPAVAGTTSLTLPTDSVQPGLVLVAASSFTAAASVSINNCFSSTYQNYRIVLAVDASASGNSNFRLRASGVDASGTDYSMEQLYCTSTTIGAAYSTGQTYSIIGQHNATTNNAFSADVYNPAIAKPTTYFTNIVYSGGLYLMMYAAQHGLSTAYDGFSLIASVGTFTGTVRVYGYRDSITA